MRIPRGAARGQQTEGKIFIVFAHIQGRDGDQTDRDGRCHAGRRHGGKNGTGDDGGDAVSPGPMPDPFGGNIEYLIVDLAELQNQAHHDIQGQANQCKAVPEI